MTVLTEDVNQAAQVLHAGGLIAYATEAVFGLGCDPQNQQAIERILHLKQRPADKGLILIAAGEAQLSPYLNLSEISHGMWQQVHATWPGPVTWLLPAAPEISHLLRGRHDTLAVRVSAHPQVRALCKAYGGAVVSTSANRSEQSPARNVEDVMAVFGGELDLVLLGQTTGASNPSEIRDGRTGKIVRAG